MDINSTKDVEKATQAQGNFIDLKDGGKIIVRLVSGIKGVKEHNLKIKGNNRQIMCPVAMETWEAEDENRPLNKGIRCPVCEGGDRKVRTNFLAIVIDDKGSVGVLKKGPTVFKPITDLMENGYVLSERPVIISRKGSTLNDTEYSVIPAMKDQPLTDEEKLALAEFQKDYDLEARSQPMSYDNIVRKLNGEDPIFDDDKGDKLPD